MAEVHVLDDYYLAVTLLITIGYQLFLFSIAFSFKFDKLTGLSAVLSCSSPEKLTALRFRWRHKFCRLSYHHSCIQRPTQCKTNYCLSLYHDLGPPALRDSSSSVFSRRGKDDRFDDKRDDFFKFLAFWIFQMTWVWVVSLPVTILNSPNVQQYPQHAFGTGRDIAGIIIYTIGLTMETITDSQKYYFRTNNPKSAICDKGFFSWSRHPNYFGEIIIQFGMLLIILLFQHD
jgi:hypothetical protein